MVYATKPLQVLDLVDQSPAALGLSVAVRASVGSDPLQQSWAGVRFKGQKELLWQNVASQRVDVEFRVRGKGDTQGRHQLSDDGVVDERTSLSELAWDPPG